MAANVKPQYRRIKKKHVPVSVLEMYEEDEWHAPISFTSRVLPRYVVKDRESGVAFEFYALKSRRKNRPVIWLVADANRSGVA